MKNILFFYKTTADFNNTGEVLIYKVLLDNLREYGNVIVDDSPRIQPLFLNRIGIHNDEKLSRYSTLSFVKYIFLTGAKNIFKRKPIYFVTGVGDHVVKGNKDVVKNMMSLIFILVLRICGIKMLRIGMSMAFAGSKEKFSERLLSSVISNYYVRDRISLKQCIDAGVKAKLAPDLSWGYKVEGINVSNSGKKQMIFSFRDYIRKNENDGYKKRLYTTIGNVVRHISKDPYVEVLFTYQCDYDHGVMEEIKHYCKLDNVTVIEELITLQNANQYYGESSVIITNRLHVLLLGYKYGALTIGLTDVRKHSKIAGIFKDEGIENHLIDINQEDHIIIEYVDNLLNNCDLEWKKIHKAEIKNYTALKEVFASIFASESKG